MRVQSFTQSRETELWRQFHWFTLFTAACLACLMMIALPAKAAQRQLLSGHVPEAVSSSRMVSQLSRGTRLDLAIGLPLRNQAELDTLLEQLADPASPNYKRFLTSAQFTAKFGPTVQDYEALKQFATENGLVVTGTHPNRVVLDVQGTVPNIERMFNVKMMNYHHPLRGDFYAPDSEPSLYLDTKMLGVSGLDNFVTPRPMGLKVAPMSQSTPYVTGSGPSGLFIGKDFRTAYAPDVTNTGTGQVVGLLEFDGFYASDVQRNATAAKWPVVPTQTVLLNGFSGAPGSSNIEVILDIMMASYMAPGLSKVIVYEGYYPNDVLNRMATDNLAQQLSSSWGFGIDSTTEQIFRQFIAQGQSLTQASGDSGAYLGGAMTPCDNPNLTVVGGTSLSTAAGGGTWQSESTWTGSGGGVSTTYPIPSYQQGVSMALNGGSTTMRNLPDVGLTADIQMYLIYNNGQQTGVGGTSAAAPLWAGFVALANQHAAANAKAALGFLNPLIYAIGKGGNYALDFHDVKTGTNSGFSAATGYDLTTGWGSPAGQHLIYDLTGTSAVASFGLTSSAAALTIKPSSTGSVTLTVAAKNGFTGNVSLTASGLPTGVTAAFSPASTSSMSGLTFTAGATVVSGTYTITITGVSGSLSSSTTVLLTVVVPNFGLSAYASSLTVPTGTSGSSTITVGAVNGFTGSVALTASGLPTGVTAAFSPASTSITSRVTFVASSTAVAGTYPITITGTSGALTARTTVSLTVVVPTFSLSPSSTSLTLLRGTSGNSTITVSGVNGFAGLVTLTASGLPTGVTTAFSPASTTNTSVVTFTVGATVVTGVYPVTITGVSGSLSSTTTILLTVAVPGFGLSASPASLTVPAGRSGSSTITVSAVSGFTGSVALTASGLPTGVTAVFSPASTNSRSAVTFTVGAAVAGGTYTVTITGISGTMRSTTTVALTVVVPSFSLSASDASLVVPQGKSGSSTVTVIGVNSFSGSVALTASGLPSGVTAAFSPASTSSRSAVTFTVGTTVASGTYPLTITGVSGTLTSKTTASLVVIVPSFSLSAASLSVPQGKSGSGTVSVIGVNGFTSNVALAASGLPTGVAAAFSPTSTTSSVMTLTASSATVAGPYLVTITGTSGTLRSTTTFTLTITVPNFSLSFTPGMLGVPRGLSASGVVTVAAVNGFNGNMTMAATGLPSGVTAKFGTLTGIGTMQATFTASSTAMAGNYPVTVTGVSGMLTHNTSFTLSVLATTAGIAMVDLSPFYNVNALVSDYVPFAGDGLDGGMNGSSTAYSANWVGVKQIVGGSVFFFGPANAMDAVSGRTVALPPGKFTSIQLLATAVNGNQAAQVFKVTYTDGSASTFTQNVSDWFVSQNYSGELVMPYRNNAAGQRDNRTFYLHEYSYALTPTKTVASITLPNNRKIVLLAINLTSTTAAAKK